MNLHISAPSVFINTFHKNLVELGLENNNKIILRSAEESKNFPAAKLYTPAFQKLVGGTLQYKKVFIHQFSPLMYRWVARNDFKQLNWMVWGADLYNLPALENQFYEPLTRKYVKSNWNSQELLYRAKVLLTASMFKHSAYKKIDHVLTWMSSEFAFAKKELPIEKASHKFFFYENQTPYHKLKDTVKVNDRKDGSISTYIIGNSGAKTNNHLDVIRFLAENKVKANLIIPVSYGDSKYVRFLKDSIGIFKTGSIEFLDRFMNFDEYVSMLNSTDGLIMNTLRPQGYGNIFMMIALNKPVFINERNVSLPDLDRNGIPYQKIHDLLSPRKVGDLNHSEAINNLFSRKRLSEAYQELFS